MQELDTNPVKVTALQDRILQLEKELQITKKEVTFLKSTVNKKKTNENNAFFNYDKVCTSDDRVKFYTGLPTTDRFDALFDFLDFGPNGEHLNQYNTNKGEGNNATESNHDHQYLASKKKKNKKCTLSPKNQLFLTMCRLRQGFHEEHLAYLFNVSQSTVSRYCLSIINYMFLRLGSVQMWPSRAQVDKRMPDSFKDKFPKCRCIIDCTEIVCEIPQSLIDSSSMFSHYKGRVTLKGMVGIEPASGITFVSQLYPSSTSDREIVLRSGLLQSALWVPGDTILADKGFTIQDLFDPIPSNDQYSYFSERKTATGNERSCLYSANR